MTCCVCFNPVGVPCCGCLAGHSGYAAAARVVLSHLTGLVVARLVQTAPAKDLASPGQVPELFQCHGTVRSGMMSRDGLPQLVLYGDLPCLLRSMSRVSYLPE